MQDLDSNLSKHIVDSIKNTIKENVDAQYTEYKEKCLQDLSDNLERKRNEVVKDVLDGIDIYIGSNEPYSFEPIINIKVEKKVYIKE